MTPVTAFAGKKVAIFGLGGSGLAGASALLAGGADVVGWDDNAESVVTATSAFFGARWTTTCPRLWGGGSNPWTRT